MWLLMAAWILRGIANKDIGLAISCWLVSMSMRLELSVVDENTIVVVFGGLQIVLEAINYSLVVGYPVPNNTKVACFVDI